ncbi:MAG: 3D-(3,5/4)-trihydroxycyclohexane-1,2-dione acylhydrolase (decyclizing) [Vicinamibacterales bacterium]
MAVDIRLTVGQAVVRFLQQQAVERDGRQHPFIGGVFGIFGHGNVAGLGQALHDARERLPFYLPRNEQAMVHAAAAYAKTHNRLRALACTTSIGPGATNMVTAAAGATINRLPVLLLPGDIFATRRAGTVLQQLEHPLSPDISVNDCLAPVSRYWDRINRPEQLVTALPEAFRVLTSPAETGAVTLALPQDVQAEAFDFPAALFEPRVWVVPRPRPDAALVARAAAWIRESRRPLVIAGGGVLYSEASAALARLAEATGIPVAEIQAGKSALPFDHPQQAGSMGVTGADAANALAREADLVLAVGTRLTDFTTASKTAFAHPSVRVIGVNLVDADAAKLGGLPLVGDARAVLDELQAALVGHVVPDAYARDVATLREAWSRSVDRARGPVEGRGLGQGQVIDAVNQSAGPRDVVVCAAGSLPGDLHKLWRAREPGGYHLEYGYSCMGYEVAGGLGVRMAAPDREVYVMVGDGSYLMMSQELATAAQEGIKLIVVLVDNQGFGSIGSLSRSVGADGFGTRYRRRSADGQLDGELLAVDYVANAASLGVRACRAATAGELADALAEARRACTTSVIVVPVDPDAAPVAGGAWWDVPVAEVSDADAVRQARAAHEAGLARQRVF